LASEKGTAAGEKAAGTVSGALAAATSGSKLAIVKGSTSDVVKKHEQPSCPCNNNIRRYNKAQRGLPEGFKQLISKYYTVKSACKCKSNDEIEANYLLRQIQESSKDILTNTGRPVTNSTLGKEFTQKVEAAVASRGGYMRLARTRKKKNRIKKQESRRRTRKINIRSI
jgi:hypothetical protein